jgi:CheY-like chemotaxis protein
MRQDLKILLVDDEETFLHSTAELLRRTGFLCDAALDLREAQRLLEQAPYDMVIADVNMPGNVNLEFVRQ